MSDEQVRASGQRLAKDLRRIRESRGISIAELHADTKIPRNLLTSFEESALFDHPQFNLVYLRSFVRTYASSIGIPAEAAADALDEAVEGRYEEKLSREFLADEVSGAATERKAADETAHTEEVGKTSEEVDATQTETDEEEREVGAVVTAGDTSADSSERESWASSSPPSRGPAEHADTARTPVDQRTRSNLKGWSLVLVGIVGLGLLIWLFTSVLMNSDEVAEEPRTESPQETDVTPAEEPEPEPEQAAARPTPVLEDSLVFFVVAEEDDVDPIRITVDNDLRRPYWIDEGDSARFSADSRIIFEEQLDVIRLNLQGYDYPTDRTDARGRIVVTRDSAQAFFERLPQ